MSATREGFDAMALPDIARRLANSIRMGKVAEVDPAKARVRVSTGGLTSDWIPWATSHAGKDRTWWSPTIGDTVLVLSPGGEMGMGVAMLGIYNKDNAAPSSDPNESVTEYEDGTRVSYNKGSKTLTAKLVGGGKAVIEADGGITLKGPIKLDGDVTITGDTQSQGEISAQGEVSTLAAGLPVKLSTHMHPTAASGPASPPTPGT